MRETILAEKSASPLVRQGLKPLGRKAQVGFNRLGVMRAFLRRFKSPLILD